MAKISRPLGSTIKAAQDDIVDNKDATLFLNKTHQASDMLDRVSPYMENTRGKNLVFVIKEPKGIKDSKFREALVRVGGSGSTIIEKQEKRNRKKENLQA